MVDPILLSPLLNASEVPRQALNIENVSQLPVEFYEKTLQGAHPSEVESLVPTLNTTIESGSDRWNIGFTHPTAGLDDGKLIRSCKEFPTMLVKVKELIHLADQFFTV